MDKSKIRWAVREAVIVGYNQGVEDILTDSVDVGDGDQVMTRAIDAATKEIVAIIKALDKPVRKGV